MLTFMLSKGRNVAEKTAESVPSGCLLTLLVEDVSLFMRVAGGPLSGASKE